MGNLRVPPQIPKNKAVLLVSKGFLKNDGMMVVNKRHQKFVMILKWWMCFDAFFFHVFFSDTQWGWSIYLDLGSLGAGKGRGTNKHHTLSVLLYV